MELFQILGENPDSNFNKLQYPPASQYICLQQQHYLLRRQFLQLPPDSK